jgi:hypothetical protein
MPSRPAIPRPLEREVLVEAGYRCAIPACKQHPVEIHHIEPWAKVKEHVFENLIALCGTDHKRAERKEIDRQALLVYKRNLGILTGRYGDAERRLLDLFAKAPDAEQAQFDRAMDFEFMYLLQDGLLARVDNPGMAVMRVGGFSVGPTLYALTPTGVEFVNRWAAGQPVED